MASELECDICDTVDRGRKLILISMKEKTQLVLFDWSSKIGATVVKIDGSVLEGKSSFKLLVLDIYVILYIVNNKLLD